MSRDIKVGDKVKIVRMTEDRDGLSVGDVILVVEDQDEFEFFYCKEGVEITYLENWPEEFELVEDNVVDLSHVIQSSPLGDELLTTLGVFRPNLEDRKVGKVPMHMVFDGFPNALQHLAEIMGWAADKKGYALHDWKNLPGAEMEFPAANYRHGSDNSKQKSLGLTAIDRVDHESSKLHIMHQVFNLLAEAELVLTGKIQ